MLQDLHDGHKQVLAKVHSKNYWRNASLPWYWQKQPLSVGVHGRIISKLHAVDNQFVTVY